MYAENSAVVLVDDDLNDAVTALVFGNISARITKRVALDLSVKTLSLNGLARLAYACNLRVGVDYSGDRVVVHSVLLAEDIVYADLALAVCGMSKHRLAVDVACRPNAGNVSFAVFARNDCASFCENADIFETETCSRGTSAYGNENAVSFNCLCFAADFVVYAVGTNGGNLCGEKELNALLLVVLEQERGNFAVCRTCDVVEHFDNLNV